MMITAVLLAAALAPAPPPPTIRSCVRAGASDTHYTPVDDRTIVVESGRSAWRLTVSPTSQLTAPGVFLINEVRGPSTLCRPIDFQLYVATPYPASFRTPMIAQGFEPIGRDEARALLRQRR